MLDTAIRYIHARLYSKVSLADIAAHLKVSPSYTCRLFQKHLGMTTAQYIHFLRVEKVKDILKNTDRPINRITDMFLMDGDYLRQVFKRETGMTMQEYMIWCFQFCSPASAVNTFLICLIRSLFCPFPSFTNQHTTIGFAPPRLKYSCIQAARSPWRKCLTRT